MLSHMDSFLLFGICAVAFVECWFWCTYVDLVGLAVGDYRYTPGTWRIAEEPRGSCDVLVSPSLCLLSASEILRSDVCDRIA